MSEDYSNLERPRHPMPVIVSGQKVRLLRVYGSE